MEASHALGYEFARKAVEQFADGDPNRCWGSMVYACQGSLRNKTPSCRHEERYWIGVGVEGPDELRKIVRQAWDSNPISVQDWDTRWATEARVRYETAGFGIIPSPFYAGPCPRCGGDMAHINWKEDVSWWPDFRLPPADVRYFRVPDEAKAAEYARINYGGAELVGSRSDDKSGSR